MHTHIGTHKPAKLCHHRWCLVMHPIVLHKNLKLFKAYKSSKKFDKPYIPEDGMYIFGGLNELGYSTNKLWVLKVGIEKLQWVKIETETKEPTPRYAHSMHYIDYMNCIVVYGGRNSPDPLSQFTTNQFLNDIWLFHVERQKWIEFNCKGEPPKAVYAHWSWVYGSQLMIFGGMNELALNSTVLIQVNLTYLI